MLEKGTMTLTSGYFPSAIHMALLKHVGPTHVSHNFVCFTRGERHYRTLNNCSWHSGQGGFHGQCTASCFPGSVAIASVIRWFFWTSFPLAWEEPMGILSFMESGPLDCGRVTSAHIHCQRGVSFLALFISTAGQ